MLIPLWLALPAGMLALIGLAVLLIAAVALALERRIGGTE
jgi:hypothetical protein